MLFAIELLNANPSPGIDLGPWAWGMFILGCVVLTAMGKEL